MRNQLYAEHDANYPRLKSDVLFVDYSNAYQYNGFMDETIRYIEKMQLLNPVLWDRFVQQFREDADGHDDGWRGEYWGKMMRGACFVYSYTRNDRLYQLLKETVRDMMDAQDAQGRISSYGVDHEFDGWDIWCRKYVLLGMQYFLEICTEDDFAEQMIQCMCRQADYIIDRIGDDKEGKLPITSATRHWRGLNSSSILEPMVRLYNITGEQRFFDFATYIVDCGGTDVENLFELAYENELYPYQYPVTKAYEMISCFEGLLEYYRVNGIEKYKLAVIRFADKILESDFTIIGSCGCTHELFDHSTVRQANTDNGKIAQETCVTVTLMKFLSQLTVLTGDSKYMDAFEISMYNAYLGAVNTEKAVESFVEEEHTDCYIEPLPFDSYSPLIAGTRGNGIGGHKVMSDNHYYGCCAAIGAAGCGMIPKMQLLATGQGFAMNLFIDGMVTVTTPMGHSVTFETQTTYPKSGQVTMILHMDNEEAFELLIRNPGWSANTSLAVNRELCEISKQYFRVFRTWRDGDCIELNLDMRTKAFYPISYGHEILMNKVICDKNYMVPTYDKEDPIAEKHIALRRGPIVLAQENRLGYSVDDPIEVAVKEDGYVDAEFPAKEIAPYSHILELQIPLKNQEKMTVTDYASAGKLWNEQSKMAAWMLTR